MKAKGHKLPVPMSRCPLSYGVTIYEHLKTKKFVVFLILPHSHQAIGVGHMSSNYLKIATWFKT